MSEDTLFSGQPLVFGSLSNETALVDMCPEEFHENNKWSNYARTLFLEGASTENWSWKTEDEETAIHQLNCFDSFLRYSFVKNQDKLAVAGWMLSEMLNAVPEHIPTP